MNSSYNYIRQASLFTMHGLPDPRMESTLQATPAETDGPQRLRRQSPVENVFNKAQALRNLLGWNDKNFQQQ
jgi:hypothetical protein